MQRSTSCSTTTVARRSGAVPFLWILPRPNSWCPHKAVVVVVIVGTRNKPVTIIIFEIRGPIAKCAYTKLFKSRIEKSERRIKKVMAYVNWWDTRQANWSVTYKHNAAKGHSLALSIPFQETPNEWE